VKKMPEEICTLFRMKKVFWEILLWKKFLIRAK
jgi:hypothetical protein